jgi:hypothetical protein
VSSREVGDPITWAQAYVVLQVLGLPEGTARVTLDARTESMITLQVTGFDKAAGEWTFRRTCHRLIPKEPDWPYRERLSDDGPSDLERR